jgi:hypothetical protein
MKVGREQLLRDGFLILREVVPADQLEDMRANGPRHLQWNIALYEDSVLWVVPGSHRRLNTEEENASLRKSGRVPLPGSIPVELSAGDGVVYINFLLHWGSNYSSKMRRTLHGGHSIFTHQADLSFMRHLAPWARELFARFDEQSAQKKDLTEAALRAAIDKDADAYWAAVEGLQPGADDNGKLVLTIYLSKTAYHAWILRHPEDNSPPAVTRDYANTIHSITLNWGPNFCERFSRSETDVLWQRFTLLDRTLQSDEEQFVPGYGSGWPRRPPMKYYIEEALDGYQLDDFIASWDA